MYEERVKTEHRRWQIQRKLLAFVDREKQNLKFKGLLEIVFMNRAELEKRTKTQK
jgi:hypothetical protein